MEDSESSSSHHQTSCHHFFEEHAWPLTSSTSVYSGARRRQTVRSTSNDGETEYAPQPEDTSKEEATATDVRWATAQHTCHVQITEETGRARFASRLLMLNDEDQQSCVGYSTVGSWEALVILNDSRVAEEGQRFSSAAASAAVAHQASSCVSHHPTTTTTTGADDDGSVTVASTAAASAAANGNLNGSPAAAGGGASPKPPAQRHHHRRNSSFQLSVPDTASTSTHISFTTAGADGSASSLLLQPGASSDPLDWHTTVSTLNTATLLHEPSSSSHGPAATNAKPSAAIANLVLQETSHPSPPLRERSNRPENEQDDNDECSYHYSTTLDFRPLAVTLMDGASSKRRRRRRTNEEGDGRNDNDESATKFESSTPVIWLGSADHNKLCCYVLANAAAAAAAATTTTRDEDSTSADDEFLLAHSSDDNSNSNNDNDNDNKSRLVAVLLDDAAFSFDTPVMGMDCLTVMNDDNENDATHFLAVSCQDGTVRLISFRYYYNGEATTATMIPQDIRHNQVIVDGPVVSLSLQEQQQQSTTDSNTNSKRKIHLVVGSLCGYVAELYLNHDDASSSTFDWEGPFMVDEGFWNTRLQAEDSVLAVHAAANGCVAFGTHMGRVLLYQRRHLSSSTAMDNDGSSYAFQWECQLPYPIHALTFVSNDRLAVTTRRSLHIFRRRRQLMQPRGKDDDDDDDTDTNKKNQREAVCAAADRVQERLRALQKELLQRQNGKKFEMKETTRTSEAISAEPEQRDNSEIVDESDDFVLVTAADATPPPGPTAPEEATADAGDVAVVAAGANDAENADELPSDDSVRGLLVAEEKSNE